MMTNPVIERDLLFLQLSKIFRKVRVADLEP